MRDTKKQSMNKIQSLWKNKISALTDRINLHRNNISSNKKDTGDMGDTHTPISRLDLTGLTKEQAKAEIDKIIDEKIEKISHLELSELKIDYFEKEKQRAKAAERISERRNRRKEQACTKVETIVTEQGVYSDYKTASIFDVIQPEAFPLEEEDKEELIEGQVSISEAMAAVETLETVEASPSVDKDPIREEVLGIHIEREERIDPESIVIEEKPMNTTIDAAVDKVFVFFEKSSTRASGLYQRSSQRSNEIFKGSVAPVVIKGTETVARVLQMEKRRNSLKKILTPVLQMLIVKEMHASARMCTFIDWLDRKNESLINHSVVLVKKFCHRFDLMREYAELHKKRFIIQFAIGAAAIAVVMLTVGSMTAYEYVYNGKVLGTVKNQEDVYKTIDIIGDKLCYEYDAEITIDKDKDIRFNKVVAFHQEIDDKEDILNRLTYMRDMKANGHGIFVDGSVVAIMESEGSAKEILSELQGKYTKSSESIQYKRVGFEENVEIKDIETKLGDLVKKDQALEYMMTGAVEKKIHLVQSGETFSEIAKLYGIKQSELKVSNPEVIPEKLQIGQEICLNQIVPLVTVQTVEVAQYKESIPFEISYENTGSLFKNEQTVKSKGANGEKEVVAEIVRNNGIEASRTEISATILAQPTSQVVMVGTKEPPPLIGTGTLIYPIRGSLTSRYGTRWGRLHSGIDLAAPSGTKIKAADGGKVIFSGYNGSLGYMIKIDHGGGRVTLYGHCSKLHVKVGERVYQGQHIANVGNTGRSTGPHVHFEVQINGKTKNPLNYL